MYGFAVFIILGENKKIILPCMGERQIRNDLYTHT